MGLLITYKYLKPITKGKKHMDQYEQKAVNALKLAAAARDVDFYRSVDVTHASTATQAKFSALGTAATEALAAHVEVAALLGP